MNEELFKSSLDKENSRITRSYNITKLFYIAFFGGIVPTVVLGTINARWLNIKKSYINLMIALGIAIFIGKFIIIGLIISNHLNLDRRTAQLLFKGLSILVYLIYYNLLKEKYQQHIVIQGSVESILRPAFLWVFIGMIIEISIAFIEGVIVGGAL